MSDVALGIDVSTYQVRTPPLKGLSFLFARATIGTRADDRYDMHIANARKAGLVTGAYHFNDRHISAVAQARAFLAAAGAVDFYFLDVEGRDAMSPQQIRDFFTEVRRGGKRIGLYHSASGFPELGQDFNWIAMWAVKGRPPSHPWTFWQYRGSPLDLDRFNGSTDELRALARGLPESDTGVAVQTFDLLPTTTIGTLTVAKPGHAYQRLLDGTLHEIIPGPAWTDRQAFGPVKLHVPIPGGLPGADRQTVNVVGIEAAAVLVTDGVFKPKETPVGDCTNAVGAAREKDRDAVLAAVRKVYP